MEVEEHIDCDLAKDEWVGIVASGLLPIVREHFRFYVALHKSRSKNSQRRNCEWNVEPHVKCSRRQDHRADWRRVIVDPGCDRDGSKTVREYDHIFDRDAELLRNVTRKGVHIFDHVMKAVCRAAIPRRASMTARVPCEDRDVVKSQRIDRFLPTTGMLVSTMEKQQRFVRCLGWNPRTVKQFGTVPTTESSFSGFHLLAAIRSLHPAVRRQSHRSRSYLFRDRDNCEASQRPTELFADAELVCLSAMPDTLP